MAVAAISIDYAIHCVDLYKAENYLNIEIYIPMIYFEIILY